METNPPVQSKTLVKKILDFFFNFIKTHKKKTFATVSLIILY